MKPQELRYKYLEFFQKKGHKVTPSASLVPQNDPTVLFTTAGMHPLVPFLLGEKHPLGSRLTNFQKSVRTDDIDEVGDDTHLTFFEMLGNWSLGEYWKNESIQWSFEFLTSPDWLNFDLKNLAVTVFGGDADAPRDDESADIWKSLGVPPEKIAYLGKKDNWWGPAGVTGPCGPDTEIFYWVGEGEAPEVFDPENKKWVEIWNNVFMQYNKTIDGKYEPLRQKNVDTGMGLERVTAILENSSTIFETYLFIPILEKIRSLAKKQDTKSERIIADHLRAATFLICDGVLPSNKDRGYVLRRLIRRAVTYGKKLGIDNEFSTEIAAVVIHNYSDIYRDLSHHANHILEQLNKEEMKFRATLKQGLPIFEQYYRAGILPLSKHGNYDNLPKILRGKDVFDLVTTYGFPRELVDEMAQEKNVQVDWVEFEQEFSKHQELSRTASAGQFKGGLADHSEKIIRLHTVSHLMNAALRKVLGEHVSQKGSNITEERTRFDFTHDKKMTDEEKKKVEELVNDWITRDLPVKKEILPLEDAKKLGAIGVFGEKYPDTVSVYSIIDPQTNEVVSREFCGGPHVEHTGVIGSFKIIKEEASSAGVRRIKAVVE